MKTEIAQTIIEARIKAEEDFAVMCLLALYQQQEEDEQESAQTMYTNNKGFNKTDSLLLSPIAEKVKNKEQLTHVEIAMIKKTLLKYSKQLSLLLTQKQIEE